MEAKNRNTCTLRFGKAWLLCVFLLALPSNIAAFHCKRISAPFVSTRPFGHAVCPLAATSKDSKNESRRTKTAPIYAQDTKVMADIPPVDSIPPASGLLSELELNPDSTAVQKKDFLQSFQVQLRSLDRDTVINFSILIIALAAVAYQVFTIDTGITRGWSPEEVAYRVPIDNWRSYNDVLGAAPIQTKAITSATVYTIGDIISQRTEGVEVGELDRGRIGRSLAAGLIGHGPLSHV